MSFWGLLRGTKIEKDVLKFREGRKGMGAGGFSKWGLAKQSLRPTLGFSKLGGGRGPQAPKRRSAPGSVIGQHHVW